MKCQRSTSRRGESSREILIKLASFSFHRGKFHFSNLKANGGEEIVETVFDIGWNARVEHVKRVQRRVHVMRRGAH